MTLVSCPTCGATDLAPHCNTSPTCDLFDCHRCKSFGTRTGSRWVRRQPPPADVMAVISDPLTPRGPVGAALIHQ